MALDPLAGLRALLDEPEGDWTLDRGLIEVARVDRPELDDRSVLAALDTLAASVPAGAPDEVDAVRRALFEVHRLRGNETDYYAPDNSHVDHVLERRQGLPILLAALWIEVARRAGHRAEGVGFPGHFLVRHWVDGAWTYLDAFRGGRVVSMDDLRTLLGGREVDPRMLDPVSSKAILLRISFNLKHAYLLRKDLLGVIRAQDRILLLEPRMSTERRDRGLAYAQVGFAAAAIDDLEAYLAAEVVPDEERSALETTLARLRALPPGPH